ncbi:MAG: PKD domain-containing protein [Elusimicrobiota bacterium]
MKTIDSGWTGAAARTMGQAALLCLVFAFAATAVPLLASADEPVRFESMDEAGNLLPDTQWYIYGSGMVTPVTSYPYHRAPTLDVVMLDGATQGGPWTKYAYLQVANTSKMGYGFRILNVQFGMTNTLVYDHYYASGQVFDFATQGTYSSNPLNETIVRIVFQMRTDIPIEVYDPEGQSVPPRFAGLTVSTGPKEIGGIYEMRVDGAHSKYFYYRFFDATNIIDYDGPVNQRESYEPGPLLIKLINAVTPVEDPPVFLGMVDDPDLMMAISYVHAMDADNQGNFYALFSRRVRKIDRQGNLIVEIGREGKGDGHFYYATNLAVYDTGDSCLLYVVEGGYSDPWNARVQKFTCDGVFLKKWGSVGSGPGQFNSARGINVDKDGNVYVIERGNKRIQKFDPEGNLLMSFGLYNWTSASRIECMDVAVGPDGSIYVSEGQNSDLSGIIKYDAQGNFLLHFAQGMLSYAKGIEVDPEGNIYVTEINGRRFQKFDPTGKLLSRLGTYGWTDPGEFIFMYDIAVDANYVVYTVDEHEYAHRAQFFWYPDRNFPPTVEAGPPQTANIGQLVTLSGTATDPNDDPMTYEWTLTKPDGSQVSLGAGLTASFTPDAAGAYIATLTAADDELAEGEDSTEITVVDDACPDDPDKTAPGACGCGVPDTDSDGDGTADCIDDCPADLGKTEPGICGCGAADTDSDGDGAADCIDDCPADPVKTEPGSCGCGVSDSDSDDDGTADCVDDCPYDAAKTEPGICGCGVADTDSDGDGAADCIDDCSADPGKTEPGACGCGVPDTDSDGDGTPDCADDCPADPGKTEPGICGCGTADTDSDGDGTSDCHDGCPDDADKTEPSICGCGVADTDSDGDGTSDCHDGCPDDGDKTEPGICGCGVADTDSDGDGTPDCIDECPADSEKIEPGICGCGMADTDSDGDGTADCIDECPADSGKTEPGICGCGVADTDSDGDGTADCHDECPNDADKIEPGICGCGVPDTDSDGDGTADCHDQCPNDAAKTESGVCGCGVVDDADGDGAYVCAGDCDDSNSEIHPGAEEVCDAVDNDCDGTVDEGCDDDDDGVLNFEDNCPADYNPDQTDYDDDGQGDVCDDSIDGDEVPNGEDGDASAVVGAAGGTVSVEGVLDVSFDPGAISDPTTVSLVSDQSNFEVRTTKGGSLVLMHYDIMPSGASFDAPVTLVFHYDQSQLSNPRMEAKLDIYRYIPESDLWEALGATVDTVNDTLTVAVDHFSHYAAGAPADSDADGVPDGYDGEADACPDSALDAMALNPNQYGQNGDAAFGAFEMGPDGAQSAVYDMAATRGCTCRQIAAALGAGEGHVKKGCSPGLMQKWTEVSAQPDRPGTGKNK